MRSASISDAACVNHPSAATRDAFSVNPPPIPRLQGWLLCLWGDCAPNKKQTRAQIMRRGFLLRDGTGRDGVVGSVGDGHRGPGGKFPAGGSRRHKPRGLPIQSCSGESPVCRAFPTSLSPFVFDIAWMMMGLLVTSIFIFLS